MIAEKRKLFFSFQHITDALTAKTGPRTLVTIITHALQSSHSAEACKSQFSQDNNNN